MLQCKTPNIPPQSLHGIKSGEFFDVMVGDICSPSRFFVQLLQHDLPYNLDDLIDDMTDMYEGNSDPDLDISWEEIKVGVFCAAFVLEKWLRVEVVKVISITKVELRIIDFGGNYSVHLLNMKWLVTRFCSLPAQALLARLSCLAPPHGCNAWPQASGARLLEMTRAACESGGLVARLEGWGQEGKLELVLYDTVTNTEKSGVDLRNVLVEEGLARKTIKLSDDIKYLEEMLPMSKRYEYGALRCPEYLIVPDQCLLGNQSSELSEATSIKTQLKSLLNIQNKVHSLVSRNLVSDEDENVFSRMSSLQTEYQELVARLLTKRARTGQGQISAEVFQDSEPEDRQLNRGEVVKDCEGMLEASVVTTMNLSTGAALHVIKWRGDSWVTSGEISSLVAEWRGYDMLAIMLTKKKLSQKFESVEVSASSEEILFQQMIVAEVGGMLNKSGELLNSIMMYKMTHLKMLLKLFNVENICEIEHK